MNESSELAKALDIVVRSSALEQNELHSNGYATPPIADYGAADGPEGELHLRDYWRTIRKRLWLIIGLALIASTLTALKQARQPDIYQAQARVQVDVEISNPALGASKGYYADITYMDPEYFNTQVQILSSPALLRRVARTLDLEHHRTFLDSRIENQSTWQNLMRISGYAANGKKPNQTQSAPVPDSTNSIRPSLYLAPDDPGEIERLAPYVDSLEGMLDVAQVKKTRLIDIRVRHNDPVVAAKIVNATADTFALWNLEVKMKTNGLAGTYLDKRIAELQSQIRNGEQQLVNYAQSREILSLDASQNTVVERLTGLNRLLLDAENERHLAEAAYRASLPPGAAEANAETADKSIADFKARLVELKQARSQLIVTDTDESPELKNVNQQIAALEKQLEETRRDAKKVITVNLESNYRKALDRENALRESFNKQRNETVAQNEAAINYNILKQEIQTNKGLLDGLMQRAKENDVTMAGTPNNIHVLDYASVPKEPTGPQRMRSVFLALGLALAFGIGLALFLDYLDDTIKDASDIESGLRLPSLAVIPIAGKRTKRFLPITRALQRSGNGTGQELLINESGPTAQAECYKHLRTSLLLSTPGRAPKSLLVTSSLPAEGKTTTAVNTATVLAQTGARVLIIDADMRRPQLHEIFGLPNDGHLSAMLSSEIAETEILSKISRYKDSNIYLLGSGSIPPNPAELLGSAQMKRLLDVVSRKFTHIVIDAPPIASFTDGVLIASIVDGVILVVHGGKTSRQVVRRSRQTLNDIGAKIIGVVLNRAEVHSRDYYNYRYRYEAYQSEASTGHHTAESGLISIVGK